VANERCLVAIQSVIIFYHLCLCVRSYVCSLGCVLCIHFSSSLCFPCVPCLAYALSCGYPNNIGSELRNVKMRAYFLVSSYFPSLRYKQPLSGRLYKIGCDGLDMSTHRGVVKCIQDIWLENLKAGSNLKGIGLGSWIILKWMSE